jgi:hypothetical protein
MSDTELQDIEDTATVTVGGCHGCRYATPQTWAELFAQELYPNEVMNCDALTRITASMDSGSRPRFFPVKSHLQTPNFSMFQPAILVERETVVIEEDRKTKARSNAKKLQTSRIVPPETFLFFVADGSSLTVKETQSFQRAGPEQIPHFRVRRYIEADLETHRYAVIKILGLPTPSVSAIMALKNDFSSPLYWDMYSKFIFPALLGRVRTFFVECISFCASVRKRTEALLRNRESPSGPSEDAPFPQFMGCRVGKPGATWGPEKIIWVYRSGKFPVTD